MYVRGGSLEEESWFNYLCKGGSMVGGEMVP
jgi:hypothetical protein